MLDLWLQAEASAARTFIDNFVTMEQTEPVTEAVEAIATDIDMKQCGNRGASMLKICWASPQKVRCMQRRMVLQCSMSNGTLAFFRSSIV